MTDHVGSPGQALLVGEIVRRNAETVPDRTAAALGGRTLTHRALDAAGNRLAWLLRANGIGHGDRVVSWADTSLDLLPLFVALAKLGAVFAPLNARLGATEAAEVGRLARGSLLVVDAARAADAAAVAEGCGIPAVASLPGADVGLRLDPDALPAVDRAPNEPALSEHDPHVVFFTSGSTGRPKGVVLSHRANWLRGFQGVFRDEPEISVCMFPLFHMAAFTLALAAWQTRGGIVFVESPTPEVLLGAIERHRATRFYGIPLVWSRILAADTSRFDLSSLRELDTGTSATPIELVRALKERFPGTRTRIYYGSTEVGSATMLPDADVLEKPGSVGPASPGVDVRISDEGEVLVRSPYLMTGYFDDEAATRAALEGGWFHTGDLGVLDGDGCLSIVGRKKEIIRTGGESVAPSEVEGVLADAPGVDEISIVGVPDVEWGEVVCAVVVPRDGETPTLPGLHAHGEGQLAGFKKPRRLYRVDALPRTAATGQVQRTLLIERIVSGELEASE
jgi:acyl-CoA synthetase (AMP-forming)/AMP-acid ligase II